MVIAVGLAGAAAFGGIGLAAGASLATISTLASAGWLLGSLLGNALFPEVTDQFGSRLGDTSIASSTYGRTWPHSYGSGRLACELVYAENDELRREVVTTKSGGKGGLLGGPSVRTHTSVYFGTFRVDAGTYDPDNRPVGVRRIWMNKLLVYDVTGDNEVTRIKGLSFKFFDGNAEQMPDSRMEDLLGAGLASAHRGRASIMFYDLNVTDFFGNALPLVEAEFIFQGDVPRAFTLALTGPDLGINVGQDRWIRAIDWERKAAYINEDGFLGAEDTWICVDLDTLTTTFTINNNTRLDGLRFDGNLFGTEKNFVDNRVLDPYTGEILEQFTLTGGDEDSIALGKGGIEIFVDAIIEFYSFFVTPSDDSGFDASDAFTEIHVYFGEPFDFTSAGKYTTHAPYGNDDAVVQTSNVCARQPGSGRGVVQYTRTTALNIWQYGIVPPIEEATTVPAVLASGLEIIELGTILPADIDPTATSITLNGTKLLWNSPDDTFISTVTLNTGSFVYKWSPTLGILWATAVAGVDGDQAGGSVMRELIGGNYGWTRDGVSLNSASLVALGTGELLIDDQALGFSGTFSNSVWDDSTSSLYYIDTDTDKLSRFTIGLDATPVKIKDFLADQARLAGIPSALVDVAGIPDADIMQSITISRRGPIRANILPFMQAFLIDGVNDGTRITFVKRGLATDQFTINEADCERIERGADDPVARTIVAPYQVPVSISIVAQDQNNSFQQALGLVDVTQFPVRVIESDSVHSIALPGSTTVPKLRQIAQSVAVSFQNERETFNLRIPATELLDAFPTNVGTLTLLDGTIAQVRMTSWAMGKNSSLEIELVAEDTAQYSPLAIQSGARTLIQRIPSSNPYETFLLNSTVLRPIDAITDRSQSRVLTCAAPKSEAPSNGEFLYQRVAGELEFRSETNGDIMHARLTLVDSGLEPFRTNFGKTLEFTVVHGASQVTTVTQAQLYNGANALYIFKKDTGVGVVVSFREHTDLGNGKFRVTHLIPGLKGTETLISSIAVGDRVILLDRTRMSAFLVNVANLNAVGRFRNIPGGQSVGDSQDFSFTPTGGDLKPLNPSSHTSLIDGGSNIDLSWNKRARYLTNWTLSFGTSNLIEDSELYDVFVYDDAAKTTLLRSFIDVATNTVQYDNADVITDFGVLPSELNWEVVQKSVQAGDGFTLLVTTPVF